MGNDEIAIELAAIKSGVHLASKIIAGLLIVAIAGWVTIGVSDHYTLKTLQEDVAEMKPRVASLWYQRNPSTASARIP